MVYRRSTLYGLPIVVGRRVNLAPINAATAREMLIEHGLVAGEWTCRERFYTHNQELLADMHELAQRTRERQFIVDKYQLERFYAQRIPADVIDLKQLAKLDEQEPRIAAGEVVVDEARRSDYRSGESEVDFDKAFPISLRLAPPSCRLFITLNRGTKRWCDRDGSPSGPAAGQ